MWNDLSYSHSFKADPWKYLFSIPFLAMCLYGIPVMVEGHEAFVGNSSLYPHQRPYFYLSIFDFVMWAILGTLFVFPTIKFLVSLGSTPNPSRKYQENPEKEVLLIDLPGSQVDQKKRTK